MTRIISYNVNGIRAAQKKGLFDWIKKEKYDIVCIQETKAQTEQIAIEEMERIGYKFYHLPAKKKGYSGVGIFSFLTPNKVKYGMDIPRYDDEGRVIQLEFDAFSIINAYFPSGTTGDVRQAFKMEFLHDFKNYIAQIEPTVDNLIVSGDFNICHKPVDINHPERHKKSSGFLPEEREWMDKFVEDGFIDSFREFNNESEKYSWWSYRAQSRKKNLGWRIDYHFVNKGLKKKLLDAKILSDNYHSDHCPILIEIKN